MNAKWSDNEDVLLVLSQLMALLNEETCQSCKLTQCDEMKSAQQRVFIIKVQVSSNHRHSNKEHPNDNLKCISSLSNTGKKILQAIQKSNGLLVLRIWKAGARWWNLTCNAKDECTKLANSEVAGYKLARVAFECFNENYQIHHQSCGPRIIIPEVLYFFDGTAGREIAGDDEDGVVHGHQPSCHPWALFSHAKEERNIVPKKGDTCADQYSFCDEFIVNMVKVRREFGFDEPHPRHGRVCVDHALEYAMHVLEDVIIPMHTVFWTTENLQRMMEDIHTLNLHNNVYSHGKGVTYEDMVKLYHLHIQKLQMKIKNEEPQHLHNNNEMHSLVQSLEDFVSRLLLYETKVVEDCPLPCTLCHLDLQPQNMILCKSKSKSQDKPLRRNIPWIVSILDWEESCYADPRFELLLLCRKVVANRSQADKLWHHYSAYVEERFPTTKVGPIEPWLRLESVHSLLTMCLQGMNLLQGGRSPWEGNSDLRGKIDREMYRLQNDLGWSSS
jgi:thiamine kinase-like enzyme